jgi:hypothetical protein
LIRSLGRDRRVGECYSVLRVCVDLCRSGPWFEEGGYIVVDREVSCDEGGQEIKDEQALQWQTPPLHRVDCWSDGC